MSTMSDVIARHAEENASESVAENAGFSFSCSNALEAKVMEFLMKQNMPNVKVNNDKIENMFNNINKIIVTMQKITEEIKDTIEDPAKLATIVFDTEKTNDFVTKVTANVRNTINTLVRVPSPPPSPPQIQTGGNRSYRQAASTSVQAEAAVVEQTTGGAPSGSPSGSPTVARNGSHIQVIHNPEVVNIKQNIFMFTENYQDKILKNIYARLPKSIYNENTGNTFSLVPSYSKEEYENIPRLNWTPADGAILRRTTPIIYATLLEVSKKVIDNSKRNTTIYTGFTHKPNTNIIAYTCNGVYTAIYLDGFFDTKITFPRLVEMRDDAKKYATDNGANMTFVHSDAVCVEANFVGDSFAHITGWKF
jgi:galactitol-specific phosphotransferase system IIB component